MVGHNPKERILESSKLSIRLLDVTTLQIRPLTLAERKHCINLIPKQASPDNSSAYLDMQRDILHYIITREVPAFKLIDVEEKLDGSVIKQIISFVFTDPFAGE